MSILLALQGGGGITDKSASDAGSGVESQSILAFLVVSDIGSGAESTPSILALVSTSDSGIGAEGSPGILALIPISDIGSGAEGTPDIVAIVSISDSGIGAETFSVLAFVPLSDTGSGSESTPSITADVPATDSGSGTEASPGILALVSPSDAGSGSESPEVGSNVPVSDVGSGIETSEILALVAASDEGFGFDQALQINTDSTIFDAGVGVESLEILVEVAVSDSGSGVEDLQVVKIPAPPPPGGGGGGWGGGFVSGPSSLLNFIKTTRRGTPIHSGVGGTEKDGERLKTFAKESAQRIQGDAERISRNYTDPLRTAREIPAEKIREADLRKLRTRIAELEAEIERLNKKGIEAAAAATEIEHLRATIKELQEVLRTLNEKIIAENLRPGHRPGAVKPLPHAATQDEVAAVLQKSIEEQLRGDVLSSALGEMIDRKTSAALRNEPPSELGYGLALGGLALGVWLVTERFVPEENDVVRKVGYGLAGAIGIMALRKVLM